MSPEKINIVTIVKSLSHSESKIDYNLGNLFSLIFVPFYITYCRAVTAQSI